MPELSSCGLSESVVVFTDEPSSPQVLEDSNRLLTFSSTKQNISSSTEKSANNPKDLLSELTSIKNVNKLIIDNLNINSYGGKFDQFRTVIKNNLNIVGITKTKLDDSYRDSNFHIDGFCKGLEWIVIKTVVVF